MARIRTIKPDFAQSESMGNISRDARLLFIEMWTLADDSGRIRGNSRMLASLLFPYDEDAPGLIVNWLSELEKEGCIIPYKVDGQSYYEIINFLKHQKIDKPTPTKLPARQEVEIARIREDSLSPQEPKTIDSRGFTEDSTRTREDSQWDRNGVEGKGKERKGIELGPPAVPAVVPQPKPISALPSKTKADPKRSDHEHNLFRTFWDGLIKSNGIQLAQNDHGAQAKACWLLVDRTIAQFGTTDAQEGAGSIIASYHRLRSDDRSTKGFWRMQPSTPLALSSQTVWGQVLETMRERKCDPELVSIIDEMEF
jgi:hypothetical protein